MSTCPTCHGVIQPEWFFCPNCGKVLQEKSIHISLAKQLFIYFVSFFLAPFGLVWGLRYVRNKDWKVRSVGLISLFLTVLAIGITLYTFSTVMTSYTKMLDNLSTGKYSFE